MSAYLLAAIACTVVHGALKRKPMNKAGLLQDKSNSTQRALLHQVPDGGPEGILPSDFFTHDAEKMAELNDYKKEVPRGCHPKCMWSCGGAQCDETCSPVCAPPKCETKCGTLDIKTCERSCDPPKCAVVCPTVQCEHAECPKCKTVCAPPVCSTDCAENCESVCADPVCSWNCKPSASCAQPTCALDCNAAKVCNLNADVNARPSPPLKNGQVVSQSLAYILPQPGYPLINAVTGQGPLFMPGAATPETPAPQAPQYQDKDPQGRVRDRDSREFYLRNNDGKGGMPVKYDSD